ncbi:hypothetical protein QTI66_17690 [Variovorax sp. J22R133]|uniref:hypothetical protein n=1 Tax=Variovorax brevis TaxID=3053503 RepID=UPI0025784F48|nr:hypothetical protein [Variovorax sp. J22R133]MDM0113991.1 hypothetical protein [Variovorax sp. J22R133]
MALLRQCLRELRVQRHEWDAAEFDWPATRSEREEALLTLPRFDQMGAWPARFITQGGILSGCALGVVNGTSEFIAHWMKEKFISIKSSETLPEDKARVHFEFAYEVGGARKEGIGTLSIGDKKVEAPPKPGSMGE